MIYEFQSEDGEVIEKYFKAGKCPKKITKKGKKYRRIFSLPDIMMDANTPRTVGAFAEKNTEAMIKSGKLAPPKESNTPWWRKHKKGLDKDLNKMSTAQAKRYIETGKK